jgi:periplasmic divalent cation tolerance protein
MADLAAHLQVLTTLDDRDVALTLARDLVDARLVACAQVTGPITSVYRWQGAIEEATEWYCVMKTTAQRYDALAAWIAEHHPYDTPELVATPIVAGAPDYLTWIATETRSAGGA